MKKLIVLIALLTFSATMQAQSVAQIDSTLNALHDSIETASVRTSDDSYYDLMIAANQDLSKYIYTLCKAYYKDGKMLFPAIKRNGVGVVTSDDSKLRFFSWDSWTGGTMRRYGSIIQYVDKHGMHLDCISCDSTFDNGTYYDTIITLHTASAQTIYLAGCISVISSADAGISFEAYIIKNDSLIKVDLFKKGKQLATYVGYERDYVSCKDKDIHFSKDLKKIYVPTEANRDTKESYDVYVFNGKYFVFKGNK